MTNEIKVMINFIAEFSPFYTKEILSNMAYTDLVDIIKNIVKEI